MALDLNTLQSLMTASQAQTVAKSGVRKTIDDNFPVFATPVNEDIFVYIPNTNVVMTQEGPKYQLLSSHLHTVRDGKFSHNVRCVSGLVNEAAGYDGSCPFCDGAADAKNLFFKRLEAEASRIGVDYKNDTAGLLKPVKSALSNEVAINTSEEYVTFPVVVIPMLNNEVAPDWSNRVKVCFVTWTKARFDNNLAKELADNGLSVDQFGGTFWRWNFTYDTQGRQANARDSAKNAKYRLRALPALDAYKANLDQMAAGFTNQKAVEVVCELQFKAMSEITLEANKAAAQTRHMLSLLGTPEGMTPVAQIAANPLAQIAAPVQAPVQAPVAAPSVAPVAPVAPAAPVAPVAPVAPAAPVVAPSLAPVQPTMPTMQTPVQPMQTPVQPMQAPAQESAPMMPPTVGFSLGVNS